MLQKSGATASVFPTKALLPPNDTIARFLSSGNRKESFLSFLFCSSTKPEEQNRCLCQARIHLNVLIEWLNTLICFSSPLQCRGRIASFLSTAIEKCFHFALDAELSRKASHSSTAVREQNQSILKSSLQCCMPECVTQCACLPAYLYAVCVPPHMCIGHSHHWYVTLWEVASP